MSKPRSRLIDYEGVERRLVHGFVTEAHFGKQAKHIEGAREQDVSRSPVTVGIVRIQELVDLYAGTGLWRGDHKEVVDFHEVIGVYIAPETGERVLTTKGTIHYSKKGCHVVPASPSEEK